MYTARPNDIEAISRDTSKLASLVLLVIARPRVCTHRGLRRVSRPSTEGTADLFSSSYLDSIFTPPLILSERSLR